MKPASPTLDNKGLRSPFPLVCLDREANLGSTNECHFSYSQNLSNVSIGSYFARREGGANPGGNRREEIRKCIAANDLHKTNFVSEVLANGSFFLSDG